MTVVYERLRGRTALNLVDRQLIWRPAWITAIALVAIPWLVWAVTHLVFNENSELLNSAMQQLTETGRLSFADEQIAEIQETFLSTSVDNDQTLATIRDFQEATGYVLDPHTATGVKAGKDLSGGDYPVICLATAHPAKFPDAVNQAIGRDPERPACLNGLEDRERRCEIIDASTDTVKAYLAEKAL